MTIKKAIYKVYDGSNFDEIMFKTLAEQVYLNTGENLENEINKKVNINDVLLKNNHLEYTPIDDYNPSTKKYVDDNKLTKTSELINDSDFITSKDIPSGTQEIYIQTNEPTSNGPLIWINPDEIEDVYELESIIGTEELTTIAKSLKGAINEINAKSSNGSGVTPDQSELITKIPVIETTANNALLKSNQNFDSIQTIQNNVNEKVDKITGMGLSQENYTTADKNKLNNINNHVILTLAEYDSLPTKVPNTLYLIIG